MVRFLPLVLALLSAAGCKCSGGSSGAGGAGGAAASSSAGALPSPSGASRVVLGGASIALSGAERDVLVADEDHACLRRVPLPLGSGKPPETPLPGRPSQVVVLPDVVLVTIREPGLLLALSASDLKEVWRVELPGDAWGLAVTPDRKSALITSAWSRKLSVVDLAGRKLRHSVDLAREPRGVAVTPDGKRAYVSHLVGSKLSVIDDLDATPRARRVELPPSPLRTPAGAQLAASLGYSVVLSPDGARLFAPRHALGALGKNAWFGGATVDVMLTRNDDPLAPKRPAALTAHQSQLASQLISGGDSSTPGQSLTAVTQPRAAVYRKSTDTLLVAGEGDDRLAELDARALDPSMSVLGIYSLGFEAEHAPKVSGDCAAPSGLVLNRDETKAYVWCRSGLDVVEVPLRSYQGEDAAAPVKEARRAVSAQIRFGDDPQVKSKDFFATGRRIFFNATDHLVSGGLACAGCHPEGRDDGYVWHEATFDNEDGRTTNFVGHPENTPADSRSKGYARRTPMLAGNVAAEGPYGWHAESKTLVDRELAGFGLHRWGALPEHTPDKIRFAAENVAVYLRQGLVPPARPKRELSAVERRGRELFMSDEAHCAACHDPDSAYTTRAAPELPALPTRSGFDKEPSISFKIPSLSFLSGREPYFHDGSALNIEQLIEENGDRMGKTKQLSAADKAALGAFLRTL